MDIVIEMSAPPPPQVKCSQGKLGLILGYNILKKTPWTTIMDGLRPGHRPDGEPGEKRPQRLMYRARMDCLVETEIFMYNIQANGY